MRCLGRFVAFLRLSSCISLKSRCLSADDSHTYHGAVPMSRAVFDAGGYPRLYSFIHVPKTAGDSFMEAAPHRMPKQASLRGNNERTLWQTRKDLGSLVKNNTEFIVMLRNPLKHVLSQ